MAQIEDAVKIAEVKYPREKGYRLLFIFNHSTYTHTFSNKHIQLYTSYR